MPPRWKRGPGAGAALTIASCQGKGRCQVVENNIPVAAGQDRAESASLPAVTEADTLEDRAWFANHPDHHFRARAGDGGVWLIRRLFQGAYPDVYLRTYSTSLTPDSEADSELAVLWYQASYPNWSPEGCRKWARKAIKRRGG